MPAFAGMTRDLESRRRISVPATVEILDDIQELVRAARVSNPVVIADVRYYRSILWSDTAAQRLRCEEQMAIADQVRVNMYHYQMLSYCRPDPSPVSITRPLGPFRCCLQKLTLKIMTTTPLMASVVT